MRISPEAKRVRDFKQKKKEEKRERNRKYYTKTKKPIAEIADSETKSAKWKKLYRERRKEKQNEKAENTQKWRAYMAAYRNRQNKNEDCESTPYEFKNRMEKASIIIVPNQTT